jgi:predicted methyltransferase
MIVLREVNPWRRELRDDFSRVAAVLGPRDLAPLARAVSDFSFEVIDFSLLSV